MARRGCVSRVREHFESRWCQATQIRMQREVCRLKHHGLHFQTHLGSVGDIEARGAYGERPAHARTGAGNFRLRVSS